MTDIQITAEKIENINIQELNPYERNPKIHSDLQIEQISNSIKEWGWTIPILIDEGNNIIAGHGRYLAAQNINIEIIPCIRAVDWSDEKKKAYLIADNKLAENSSWDNALLYSELKAISETEFNLSLTGMDEQFNFMEYQPNTEPNFDYATLDEGSINTAQDKINSQISGLQLDKSNQGIEVMCPHCAESFTFSGT